MPNPEESGRRRNDEVPLASIVFVAVMFLTISVANVAMHNDWRVSLAGDTHQK